MPLRRGARKWPALLALYSADAFDSYKHRNRRGTHPEHAVAGFELGYVPANGFHLAGYINAQSCALRFAQPGYYASATLRHAAVKWIDGSGKNFYRDFVVSGNRLFDILHLDNVRRPVCVVDGGFDGVPPRGTLVPP
jgi:hypothetical protein